MSAKKPIQARPKESFSIDRELVIKLRQKLERLADRMSFEECARELNRHEWIAINRINEYDKEVETYGAYKDNFSLKGLRHFLAERQLLEELLYGEEEEGSESWFAMNKRSA